MPRIFNWLEFRDCVLGRRKRSRLIDNLLNKRGKIVRRISSSFKGLRVDRLAAARWRVNRPQGIFEFFFSFSSSFTPLLPPFSCLFPSISRLLHFCNVSFFFSPFFFISFSAFSPPIPFRSLVYWGRIAGTPKGQNNAKNSERVIPRYGQMFRGSLAGNGVLATQLSFV